MSRFQAPARNSLKIALPLSRSLPAPLKQYWYIKRGERVGVRGHAPFYATLGFPCDFVRLELLFVRCDQLAWRIFKGVNPGPLRLSRRVGFEPGRRHAPRLLQSLDVLNV